jgi:hypothetical protein
MPIGEICEGSLMADSRLSGQKKSHPAGWLLDITCNTYKLAERTPAHLDFKALFYIKTISVYVQIYVRKF